MRYNNFVIWGIWQRWGATRASNNDYTKKKQNQIDEFLLFCFFFGNPNALNP